MDVVGAVTEPANVVWMAETEAETETDEDSDAEAEAEERGVITARIICSVADPSEPVTVVV